MNQERGAKVREIFNAAAWREADERARFLDEVCADDTELRREVESLLSSYDGADSFFESSPLADLVAAENETKHLKNGTRFGHYEILRQIGAGGMGEVYLATRRIIYEGENF